MEEPERQNEKGLLDEQPRGHRPKAGRLIGAGGSYRRPAGGGALARSLRIAQRRPQAILKVTRYGHGGQKILAHLHYIQRHGRLELEDENGAVVEDPVKLRRRVRLWTEQAGAQMQEPDASKERKRRVTAHFILDAGAKAKPEALLKTARQFLAEQFGRAGHEYFFVRHDDTKQPHVHVVLNLMNEDGKRLRTSVAEIQAWREKFAETARKNGIEVDASRAWERGKAPTRSRGLVRYGAPKPSRWTHDQVRRGLAARKERLLSEAALATAHGEGRRAEALRAKAAGLRMHSDDRLVQHIVAERLNQTAATPWELARLRNARSVKDHFRQQAEGLRMAAKSAEDPNRRAILGRAADQLQQFGEGLEPVPTRAEKVAVQAREVFRKTHDLDRGLGD